MRVDILKIADLIEKNSSVLDLGCGDGELLEILKKSKNANVRGIDIDDEKVFKCIEKGLNVYHGDMEEILPHYRDKSYDYVVLSLTLHQVRNPEKTLKEAVRIGKKVIVSFPNFANIKIRFNVLFNGKLLLCDYSKYEWFSENYVHFITIKEFEKFCEEKGYKILKRVFIPEHVSLLNPNLFASSAIYCLRGEQ